MSTSTDTLTLSDLRERPTVSVIEAGAALGLSKNSSYAAAHRGELPTLRFGNRIVVPVPALLRMLGAEDAAHSTTEEETTTQESPPPEG